MYPQNAYNLVTEIADGKAGELEDVLKIINNDVEDNPYFDFTKIPSIHFARFVILKEERDDKGKQIYPAYLAFESNYDGTDLDAHLMQIITNTKANNGFDTVFRFCKKFPSGSSITDEQRLAFLKTDSYYRPYFYRGTWGRTVGQIKEEEKTRNQIQDYLKKNNLRRSAMHDIYKRIKENVKLSSFKTINPPTFSSFILKAGLVVVASLWTIGCIWCLLTGYSPLMWMGTFPFVIGLGALIVFLAIVAIILRIKESTDEQLENLDTSAFNDDYDLESLRTTEDRIVQNQLTHLVEVKDGFFRRYLLKFVLFSIQQLAIYKYNGGNLGGIPSIHFARWIMIDNGKRLLFFSNFDGSWENYLGDFIDRAAVGLTGVWSNTKLFPKTKWLVFKGATDEQRFKIWTRLHQVETQVWYSAYKYLTVENINNNTAIQDGLKRNTEMTDDELKEWLIKL